MGASALDGIVEVNAEGKTEAGASARGSAAAELNLKGMIRLD